MTPTQEDYLKTIYYENLKKRKITNKYISDAMNISAPSVTEMLNRLIDAKLVKRNKEFGFLLTSSGVHKTQELLRKHRLWEVFLIDYLGYTWDEVHEDADVLEHVTSQRLSDRLNKFLKSPKHCPHGKVIYGNGIEEDFENTFLLSECAVGFEGYIHILDDNEKLLQYLKEKDVHIHDSFIVEEIHDFDGSLRLKMPDKSIEVSEKVAQSIFVRKK